DGVLGSEVRLLLPGRVREHDHGLGAGLADLLRGLAPGDRPAGVAALPAEGDLLPVPVHLAARHVPPPALRPADAAGLEGAAAAGAGERRGDGSGPGGGAVTDWMRTKGPRTR